MDSQPCEKSVEIELDPEGIQREGIEMMVEDELINWSVRRENPSGKKENSTDLKNVPQHLFIGEISAHIARKVDSTFQCTMAGLSVYLQRFMLCWVRLQISCSTPSFDESCYGHKSLHRHNIIMFWFWFPATRRKPNFCVQIYTEYAFMFYKVVVK